MSLSKLAHKLRLHTAQQALVFHAPDGYLDLLGEIPPDLQIDQQVDGKYAFVHVFVQNRSQLEQRIDPALAAVEQDALFWVSYPKGSSGVETDLNRDKLWEALADKGIRPVTQVSIDAIWSAMRFRPVEAVGK